ncbi:hypothetical protein [Enterococcus alishanensis]
MAKKIFISFGILLSAIFLIISVISWNLYLGGCAFVMAIGLTRFLEKDSYVRVTRKKLKEG